jgi:alpha-L-fucosidase
VSIPLLLAALVALDDSEGAADAAAVSSSAGAPGDAAGSAAAAGPDDDSWRVETEQSEQTTERFDATKSSLAAHVEPSWFRRAKIGLHVEWGAHSAAAWAPSLRDAGCEWLRSAEVWRRDRARVGTREWLACNPLLPWYGRTMRIDGSPTARRHARLLAKRSYDELVEDFVRNAERWASRGGADEWGALFGERSGARYVVLTARGVDGVSLWPSAAARALAPHAQPTTEVDVLGLVQRAVKRRGMRFGVRFAAGVNWGYSDRDAGRSAWGLHRRAASERHDALGEQCFAVAQYRELIDSLAPDILWNDFGFPRRAATGDEHCSAADGVSALGWPDVLAAYYNARPSGVANDRWSVPYRLPPLFPAAAALQCADFDTTHALLRNSSTAFESEDIRPQHWELAVPLPSAVRARARLPVRAPSPARSLALALTCYALFLHPSLQADERRDRTRPHSALIHTILDVVSKNGNALLSVTPLANGTLPRAQRRALLQLGRWLRKNGGAVYDTVPLLGRTCCLATHTAGRNVRFTQSVDGAVVWATVLMDLHSASGNGGDSKRAAAGARCNRLLGKREKKCMRLVKVVGLRVLPGAHVSIHGHCVRVKTAQVRHAAESHWESHIILPQGVANVVRGTAAFAVKIEGAVSFEWSAADGAGYTVGCPAKAVPSAVGRAAG